MKNSGKQGAVEIFLNANEHQMLAEALLYFWEFGGVDGRERVKLARLAHRCANQVKKSHRANG